MKKTLFLITFLILIGGLYGNSYSYNNGGFINSSYKKDLRIKYGNNTQDWLDKLFSKSEALKECNYYMDTYSNFEVKCYWDGYIINSHTPSSWPNNKLKDLRIKYGNNTQDWLDKLFSKSEALKECDYYMDTYSNFEVKCYWDGYIINSHTPSSWPNNKLKDLRIKYGNNTQDWLDKLFSKSEALKECDYYMDTYSNFEVKCYWDGYIINSHTPSSWPNNNNNRQTYGLSYNERNRLDNLARDFVYKLSRRNNSSEKNLRIIDTAIRKIDALSNDSNYRPICDYIIDSLEIEKDNVFDPYSKIEKIFEDLR